MNLKQTTLGILALLATVDISEAQTLPAGAVPFAVNATSSGTGALTLNVLAPGALGLSTNFTVNICGLSVRTSATSAAAGQVTVTGLLVNGSAATNTQGGSLTFEISVGTVGQVGVLEPPIGPYCWTASAPNAGVQIIAPVLGGGGNSTINAWGYYR